MTPEQIEFHRKRFEEYYRNLPSYKESEKAAMFQGYIMAIESMEIELSEAMWSDDIGEYVYYTDEVRSAAQSLGLKVKERKWW